MRLSWVGWDHGVVNRSIVEYARGNICTNTIEGVKTSGTG